MLGIKVLFLIGFLFASCHAFWWGSRDSSETEQPVTPPVRQFPISYIKAFAYQPMAFPQPLAPIKTYQVTRNQQQTYNPNGNMQAKEIGNALAQVFQQKFMQSQDGSQGGYSPFSGSYPPTREQQLPLNQQVEVVAPLTPAVTTSTTTTTPAPISTNPPPFSAPQQMPMRSGFTDGGYQRQLQHNYQAGNFNFDGYPQYYNEQPQYSQPFNNPFQFPERVGSNQFSGRVFGGEPAYQQYNQEALTYQFIPTSITPLPPYTSNNVKFVPCMCPVAVQITPPHIERRTDEIPILNPNTESEILSPASSKETVEERK